MTLYRGPGGTGSATSDADTTLYQDFLNQTLAARDAALQAEVNAELAETNAETAETNAETAATNAANSASSASSSASAAATSASNASSSASAAASSASSASTSATNAANSATAAAASATSAANSASTATTQASNASSSATAAASSASSAATSATNAASSASSASTSATNAANSATSAANSASSAAMSATNAANSATSASNSASAAAASASEAAGYAASINPADLVHISGTETITGSKTFSVNPTLSAGTANGLAFLNASKVLTTGSALTFDGSVLTSTGTIRSSNTIAYDDGTIRNILSSNGTGGVVGTTTNHPVIFFQNNAEGMRLTSTGLGIGTSSPGYKLDVQGTVASTNVARIKPLAGSNSSTVILDVQAGDGSSVASFYNGPSGSFVLNGSGNLGLWVTPSAWGSVWKAIQIGNGASIFGQTNAAQVLHLGANVYFDSSNTARYIASNPASRYRTFDGAHEWYTAPSGTAGNAISFTQAMTLDASGNLGIGTSSPAQRLSVWTNAGTSSYIEAKSGSYASVLYGQNNAGDAYVYNAEAANIRFFTSATERARITSSGEMLGTSAGTVGFNYGVTAGAGTSTAVFVGRHSATAGNTSSGTNSFIVWSNGNVVNTNNSYGAISDIKLKENIVDATPKLEKLCQVRVVNYNFKEGQTHKQIGVIAQELEQVFPSMVEESPDRDADGNDLGTTTKQVKYSVFVPMLIKAIQEQQTQIADQLAIINAQQAELAQLKARLDAANI